MKSFTDIEQSKKLAERLPLKSADMCYERVYFEGKQSDWFVKLGTPIKSDDIIPCWSLSALLDIFKETSIEKDKEGWVACYYGEGWWRESIPHNNPIDSCVSLIETLHKQHLQMNKDMEEEVWKD